MEVGADLLKSLKDVETTVLARKEEITRPLMASLASTRDLFKPFETAFADAKKIIKQKMLAYQVEEEERQAKEKERIAARVEKGTMREDTAIKKMGDIAPVATSAKGSYGSVQTRSITKVRVIDEAALPREYLVPDMAKITTAVLQQGVAVPGTEKYTEKIIASR